VRRTEESLTELRTLVKHNTEATWLAAHLLAASASAVSRAGTTVKDVEVTLKDALHSSEGIARFGAVIEDIAHRTNVVALNAAVEARLAGKDGWEFRMVANDVRSLAGRAADAAREIKTLIDGSLGTIRRGADRAQLATAGMKEIVLAMRQVAEVVAEIANKDVEQSADPGLHRLEAPWLHQVLLDNAARLAEAVSAAGRLQEQVQLLDAAARASSVTGPKEEPGPGEPSA
jgi:methyl-accepting chemotaxis protein